MAGRKPSEESYESKDSYVYLDLAASQLSAAVGLEISEKNVDKISKTMNIKVFKIGSRKAIMKGSFEENFKNFVEKSSDEVKVQTQHRIAGATKFNARVDAVFALLKYSILELEGKALTFENTLKFLKLYDKTAFGEWTVADVKTFVHERLMRRKKAQKQYDDVISAMNKVKKDKTSNETTD